MLADIGPPQYGLLAYARTKYARPAMTIPKLYRHNSGPQPRPPSKPSPQDGAPGGTADTETGLSHGAEPRRSTRKSSIERKINGIWRREA
ncbi:hypothetical protein ACMZ4X_02598 [Achromobacter marplatensis]